MLSITNNLDQGRCFKYLICCYQARRHPHLRIQGPFHCAGLVSPGITRSATVSSRGMLLDGSFFRVYACKARKVAISGRSGFPSYLTSYPGGTASFKAGRLPFLFLLVVWLSVLSIRIFEKSHGLRALAERIFTKCCCFADCSARALTAFSSAHFQFC